MAVSPSTSSNGNYQVFINHRGPCVKNTLASYLYHWLSDCGYRVFLDKEEMEVGDRLDSQILGAIATSSVHIAIFSPRYAESVWCLNELLEMDKREPKATIIPVFYNVKPCNLRMRKSEGNNVDYDEAFRQHVSKQRYSEQTIADWKKVLCDVSILSGLELETYNGDEGKLANCVVQLVKEKIKKSHLDVAEYPAEYPTDLDKKLQDFEKTVLQEQQRSRETKVVGIVGYGGVGKTTLAKEFFNRHRSAYGQSYFLKDVRSKTSLPVLQKTLSRDSKALVVLDDVDDARQLEELYPPLKEALSSDSLILLTSRNRNLLSRNGVSSIYKLSGLDREHSQSLFCMHAFHKQQPAAGFEDVVPKFLDACDGLPLCLKVLGSELYLKESWYWEGQYQKILDLVLPSDIHSSLSISYDRLDDQEKEIFLDISCFLIDEDKDLALRIWDGSGWQGRLNLENLEQKCILEIDCKNRIKMHKPLRDLGRVFAEKELPKRHRRLWRPTDNLFHNAFKQPIVRGINMVQGISDQSFHDSLYRPPVDMSKLHLLRAEGNCLGSISQSLASSDQLVWLCWKKCPYTSLPSWIPIRNLRALQVNLCADSQMLPDSVGDLRLEMPPLCLGNLPQLKHLDLQGTEVKKVSIRRGVCPKLQHLNLSFCTQLVEVGELPTTLTSLELQGSTVLEKISGLPSLVNLRLLDISGCIKIEELPGLDNLTFLEKLEASECKKLNESILKCAPAKLDKKRKRE